ncbi:MAG: M50 family metallopeptidase [Clostridia bacterium]|nr:M50 family metallopeptidase [Clostridia bacterium]
MITILDILNSIWPYAVAILLFLILIIIHEFGHFIAAKLLGVRVNEFAVGFGPKLFKWGKKETKYAVNLVPFGGYCAMEGEDETSTDSRAFCNKKAWRRFLIVVMGAVFNLLLGLILVAITLIPEDKFITTKIAGFKENAVSSQCGLEIGDEILAIDGRTIFSEMDLSYAFTNVADGKIDIIVERDGEEIELKDVRFATKEIDGISYLTFDFYVEAKEKTFWSYITETFNTAISYGAVVLRSLIDLITGKYGISAVSGPVGVTAAIGSVAKQSLFDLIPIMALITINLGLFNLLPLPALDGGRLVFILFEMIFRKPVPQKYESLVHFVGIVVLLGFMVLISFKDIYVLITG